MFLITGATGNVGRGVVEQLASAGHKVRAMSRNPERAQWLAGVQAVAGELTDQASLSAALDGVEAVFLFAAPGSGPGFTAAAEAAGVRRVVLLSSGAVDDGAEEQDGPIAAYHWEIEQALRASATLEWTFLRPEVFAANVLPWGYQTKAGDEIRGAYAEAASSPIHEADIADVAVAALTEDGHAGRIHHLSGPRSLTHADQARILGEVLGRPIRYVEIPVEQVRKQMSAHVPAPIVDAIIKIWAASVGTGRPVTDDVEKVTGHPARDFATWVRDHAEAF